VSSITEVARLAGVSIATASRVVSASDYPVSAATRARVLEAARDAIASASVIVNTTPLGMGCDDPSPIPAGLVGPGQVVYDMVYGKPVPTPLVRESTAAGALAIDGLGMLVSQGAIAIDIWDASAQRRAPRDVMRHAAERELATRVVQER